MKVGIICESETKKDAEIEKICDFGAVAVYRLGGRYKEKKKPSKRHIRRLVNNLSRCGISICVADDELERLQEYGITVVSDGRDVLLERAGQAAMLFSDANAIEADFLIDGGSFCNVMDTALFLLRRKRHVYINNPAYEALSEEIFCETGAVVRKDAPENTVVISMNKSVGFLRYKDFSADFSDFRVELEGISCPHLSPHGMTALASILEKSGFLAKNCIKIKYFLK